MKLQAPVQSILVSIFRLGSLRLSACTYEATSSTAANVVGHLERFDRRPFSLVMFRKRFSLVLGEKELRISYDFLAEENQI